MHKRIVLKISGEALCENGDKFSSSVIDRLTDEIIAVQNMGTEISFVVGGGNFWRGRNTTPGMDRARSDQIGMLATMMNAIYLSDVFRIKGAEAVVMTPFAAHTFSEPFEKNRAVRLLGEGKILIFAGGTGLPYFSTDTITAVRAAELCADVILFAKNVSGIYDKDPKKFADAKKYDIISYEEIINRDLRAIDISAISICRDANIESVVFGLCERDGIVRAAGCDNDVFGIGTKVIL